MPICQKFILTQPQSHRPFCHTVRNKMTEFRYTDNKEMQLDVIQKHTFLGFVKVWKQKSKNK
jgi:hypothetical protein